MDKWNSRRVRRYGLIERTYCIQQLRYCACLLLLASTFFHSAIAQEASFQQRVDALQARPFAEKVDAVKGLAQSGDARAIEILEMLLAGELYRHRKENRLLIAKLRDDGEYQIRDAVTRSDKGTAGRREIKKITINNKLRKTIRGLLAGLRLHHEDPEVRLAAVEALESSYDVANREILIARRNVELNADVADAIDDALVVFELDNTDPAKQLTAIRALSRSLDSHVRKKLRELTANQATSEAVRAAATDALQTINAKLARYQIIENVLFGLSLGSVLVLAAIGLSITFGVIGVINMAHGELIMLGAYTTYTIQIWFPNAIEYSLLIAVPAAFLLSATVGVAMERGVIRFLYGRPLETLLATFGISLILQQTVRTIYSPLNRSVITPEWASGSFEIVQGLSFTFNRLYILVFMLVVFLSLLLLLRRTRFGLEVRAVTQNRAMARAMGIQTARVDMMIFGLGAGVAGVAGVALSQLSNVGPNLGQSYIIDSFMVVVFGGVGNLWGTLLAGMSLGVVNKFLEPFAGAVLAKILVLVFIILFIQKRPRGLFPQKGRSAVTE